MGELEDDGMERAEASYREAVLKAPGEIRFPLLVLIGFPLAALLLTVPDALAGREMDNLFPAVLMVLISPLQIAGKSEALTAWIPRAGTDGFVPPKRSILQVIKSEAPLALPWNNLVEVTLDSRRAMPPPSAAVGGLEAQVKVRAGREFMMNRSYYPQAFDQAMVQFSQRGLVRGPFPELHPATPPPAPAMPFWGPDGKALLWDASKARRRLAQFAGACGAVLVAEIVIIGPIMVRIGPSDPLTVVLFAAPCGLLFVWIASAVRRLRRVTNAEIAPGKVRLGFRMRRQLAGWRSLGEVRLVAVDPTPGLVEQARRLLQETRGPEKVKRRWRKGLDRWSCLGGLLVFVEDEVYCKAFRGSVARIIEHHWRDSKQAPAPLRAREVAP